MESYKKLVAEAAEKFKQECCGEDERCPYVETYKIALEEPSTKWLIEQVAREAVAHASYEHNFMLKEWGIVFSEEWLRIFMGEE
jgi:hypothetical protein